MAEGVRVSPRGAREGTGVQFAAFIPPPNTPPFPSQLGPTMACGELYWGEGASQPASPRAFSESREKKQDDHWRWLWLGWALVFLGKRVPWPDLGRVIDSTTQEGDVAFKKARGQEHSRAKEESQTSSGKTPGENNAEKSNHRVTEKKTGSMGGFCDLKKGGTRKEYGAYAQDP